MTRDLKLSEVLLALPLMHLLTASLFLFGYCSGFGANLARFSAPPDLFAISMGEVATIYGCSLIFGGIGWVTAVAKDAGTETWRPKSKIATAVITAVTIALGFLVLVLCIAFMSSELAGRVRQGHAIPLAAALAFGIHAGYLASIWARRSGLGRGHQVLAVMLPTVLVLSLLLGMATGSKHRVEVDVARFPTCAGQPVVRELGGRFLLVLPDRRRALATFECKTVLVFPTEAVDHGPTWPPRWLMQKPPTAPVKAAIAA